MKCYLKLTLLLILPFFAFSQKIRYKKSYQDAINSAVKLNKPLFVLITIPTSTKIPLKGLEDGEVVNKINTHFIAYKTIVGDSIASVLIRKYRINTYPSYLFLHNNQELFYKDFGASDQGTKYIGIITKALVAAKQKKVADFEQEYLANPKDTLALKALITARKKIGITDNAELIESYVSLLRVADLGDYQTVLFILEAGPDLEGNAYKLSRSNSAIYNSIYKNEPSEKRLAINNAIIANTINLAIKTKNRAKAEAVANFTRATWNNDYQRGNKAAASRMVSFYETIKDTTMYFRTATNYYDNYYMTISADSIKKLEVKSRNENLEIIKNRLPVSPSNISKAKMDSLIKAGAPITRVTTQEVIGVASSSNYANELNNAANQFYKSGTKNINHLTKAMIWSKRSIELNPIWGYYDTLAHIYYAMGIYNEAIATQEIAIDMAMKSNQSRAVSLAQKAYEKMVDKTL